jgi:cytochrome bd-type quinol oxidase subunit 1
VIVIVKMATTHTYEEQRNPSKNTTLARAFTTLLSPLLLLSSFWQFLRCGRFPWSIDRVMASKMPGEV